MSNKPDYLKVAFNAGIKFIPWDHQLKRIGKIYNEFCVRFRNKRYKRRLKAVATQRHIYAVIKYQIIYGKRDKETEDQIL